jgi:glutamine---fructose-6-phosphate transaminase (isomerizing)
MMTHMEREAREAPNAVARFLAANGGALAALGRRLRAAPPPFILTSARGSSDHAAGDLKYLAEIVLGIPCASIGASVVSIYDAPLKAKGALCVTISQSGQSPDVVALQEAARRGGALTVALVNVAQSPAAANADICLPLEAGLERSVAATKSFIVSLAAAAAIVAECADDDGLRQAVAALPEVLDRAVALDWPGFDAFAGRAESLYVLGRGPSLPVAAETALKLKETCALHAEAYSIAEVMHGPLELLGRGFPVLAYSPDDAARPSAREAIARLRATGAEVRVVDGEGLPYAATGAPLLDPVSMVTTAYLAIERLARARGRDPDRPHHLKKVTETL